LSLLALTKNGLNITPDNFLREEAEAVLRSYEEEKGNIDITLPDFFTRMKERVEGYQVKTNINKDGYLR